MMHFAHIWWWLLLVPLVPLVLWMHLRSYAHLTPWARHASLVLRSVLILLVLAALADPSWISRSRDRHTVFLLDVSASVSAENAQAALDRIHQAARAVLNSPGASASLVAFGERPTLIRSGVSTWDAWTDDELDRLLHQSRLEQLRRERAAATGPDGDPESAETLTRRVGMVDTFAKEIVGDHTSLERALRLGANLSATGTHSTVFLLSDGAENQGQWRRGLTDTATLRLIALDRKAPPEVLAASITVPEQTRVNQTITPRLTLTSNVTTNAALRVFVDGYAVEQQQVALAVGENTIDLAGVAFETKGFHRIAVLMEPADDTRLENNAVSTIAVVPGKARVLYVDAEERHIPHLKDALELEGFDVDARPAAGLPQSLTELLSYDAFILSNIPADLLGARQMQMVRSYVRDFGGGFVMLGGDESYGLGGYYQTPIEETLPVRMPIQKDLNRPSLALMLVIDKSGSMDGIKIQLAKRAALATAEVINPRDQIGIVGFDGTARVILPLTPALDSARIRSSVGSLDAGGGTFLYPAVQEAHRQLIESIARRKHILILSDGQTQGQGYEQLVRQVTADGITISSIGIGEDADMHLLEMIASLGGGRAYFTNDFFTIPQIFTREALRASNNMLVERLVAPIAVDDDPALKEIDGDDLPLLTGYVATTAKAAADVPIVSDSGDPLLARWRFGLGQAVAFTSETKPRWAEDWLDWPQFTKFWGQLLRSITGTDLDATVTLLPSHRLTDNGLELIAELADGEGLFVDDATVMLSTLSESGTETALGVTQVAPGRFTAHLPSVRYGKESRFVWTARVEEQEPLAVSYAVSHPYSPELAALGGNHETLEQLAEFAGTEVRSVDDDVASESFPPSSRTTALWPTFLALGVLLIPFDILVRRLG